MKVEVNKETIDKIKENFKGSKRRKSVSRFKINKNYYILLMFMIGTAFFSVYSNFGNKYENENIKESDVTPVFLNNDIKEEKNIDFSMIGNIANNIKSLEYLDGISKIELKKNEDIYSLLDGVVDNIYLDYAYGYTITVKCDNNITVKYLNLDPNVYVNLGQKIKKGDVLGKSVDYSLMESSYIYLMVYCSGVPININSYLKS